MKPLVEEIALAPPSMSWNWDHLRYFLALARHGTLSRASTELSVSHTTVLRRIRAFENQLDTHLFDQTPDGYRITAAGELLLERVLSIQDTLDGATREIAGQDQRLHGTVVITAPDTLGIGILPELIEAMQENWPELSISLKVVNDLLDISSREADIAIRACREPPAELIGRKLGEVRFGACAARSYAARCGLSGFPREAADHAFILLDDTFEHAPFHRWLRLQLHTTSLCTTANSFFTAYALCRAGLGITVLPTYLIDTDDDLVTLTAPTTIEANDLWLLSHRNLRDNRRVRVVRQFLQQSLTSRFRPA